MRLIIVGSFCVGILLILMIGSKSSPTDTRSRYSSEPTPTASPTPPPQSVDVTLNAKLYRIAWIHVLHPSAFFLLPNFSEKRTAGSFIDTKECREVISGGFYTTDYQPTGLFISEGRTLHQAVPNALLHGYFTIDSSNNASIRNSPPEGLVRIALQTGPILVSDGSPVKLRIRDDESARRIGLGITKNGSVVFFAIYDPENTWSGPKLADMPNIVSKNLSQLTISDAINLDGGSASAFIRDDFSLQELTNVGSFFCIR